MEYTLANILEKAHQAAAKINQAAARSLFLSQIGSLYTQHQNATLGETLAVEALKAAEFIKYPHEKARCLAAAATVLVRIGKGEQGRSDFKRAVLLARAAESSSQSIEALYRIAAGYIAAGLSVEAMALLKELSGMVVNPESEVDSAAELVNIAELYDDLGSRDEAYRILTEALAIAQNLPDNWFRLERLIEIADTYASSSAPDQALPVLSEAALLIVKIEEYSQPYFLLRLAEVYITLDKKPEALEILKSIPPIINNAETAYEKAGGLIEIAEKYVEVNEKNLALGLLIQAIKIADTITNIKEKISIQIEIAEWLDETGHLDEALKMAGQAHQSCQNLEDRKSSIFCLGNLAVLYVLLQNPLSAGRMIDEIILILKETPAKTAGLGAIGWELAAEGQPALALRVAEIIREPEVLVNLYLGIAKSL